MTQTQSKQMARLAYEALEDKKGAGYPYPGYF